MRGFMREDAFWGVGLFAAIIVTAALVNRFRPEQRAQIRRLVILYVLHLIALGGHHGLQAIGEHSWAVRFLIASDLFKAFTVINLGSTLVFAVLLPAAGVLLPMIASDLLIGVGYIGSTLAVLSANGVNPSNLIAASAVASAVLALSLQTTLGNILGGVAIQLDGSVHEGDWVQLENGKQGRVRAIRWRHTVVETRDWSTIIVPNASLLSSNITILGKREGHAVPQRMWVWFNVDYRFSPTHVLDTVMQALTGATIQGVAADPPPNAVCMDFTYAGRETVATYAVRYWLTDLAADDPTNSRVRARVYTALRRAGIPLALPSINNFVYPDDADHQRKRFSHRHDERVAALRSVRLFHTLKDEEIEVLADGLTHVIYVAGETCTKQGAVAHWLYLLARGKVDIRMTVERDVDGKKVKQTTKVHETEAPDFFGEMGLMTGAPRTADVVAATDCDCFRLDKQTFERVLKDRPELAHELSDILAERRAGLIAARDGLDDDAKDKLALSQRAEILDQIRTFFSL